MNELDFINKAVQKIADEADKPTVLVIYEALRKIVPLKEALYFDLDKSRKYLGRRVYLGENMILDKGEFQDYYYSIIEMYLNKNGFGSIISSRIVAVIDKMAHEHQLRRWDTIIEDIKAQGRYTPGIYKTIMVDWLKAADNEYSIYWLKSIMASILRNQSFTGNEDDFDPVPQRYMMFGAQGIGKSQFLKRLAFGSQMDFSGNLEDRDVQNEITSKILINADDKANNKISVVDAIKSAITVPSFTFRKAYAHEDTTKLNRAVWVGSTNRQYIYTDTTGNRREMPIDLGVSLSREESRKHGQEFYLNHLMKEPNLFYDLWFTFLEDNKRQYINPVVTSGSKIDKEREELVNEHQGDNDLRVALIELLNKKVPSNIFNFEKNDILSFLADENYKNGDRHNIYNRSAAETKLIKDFDKIPSVIINKAVKLIADNNRFRIGQIEAAMYDLGYKPTRSAKTTYYKGVK